MIDITYIITCFMYEASMLKGISEDVIELFYAHKGSKGSSIKDIHKSGGGVKKNRTHADMRKEGSSKSGRPHLV